MASPAISYAESPARNPETATLAFYGTTAIRVPEGTVVDYEHDARFRIFARNQEDLDLTSRISARTSPQFDAGSPLEAGEYEIVYSVTADDGRTISTTVPILVEADGEEIWLQKTMYTLPSVDHLNSTGYTRGNNMDRQIIGIFLDDEDGAVPGIQMRRINGTRDLSVTFRKNDNWLESTSSLTGSHDASSDEGWVTISNTGQGRSDGSLASVPFVKTLYAQPEDVIYEVKWDAADPRIQPLHYYHVGDGSDYQDEFMSQWQADPDSFAVIDSISVLALLPYEDSQNIIPEMHGKSLSTFDEMLGIWDYVTNRYDELIGISYDAAEPWNLAVKSKYFARADAHGAGMAFYSSGECIGYNAPTKTWSLLLPQWGTFHEYGHGYQGNVGGSDQHVSLTEIAVNIFSYSVQEMSDLSANYNGNWIGNIDSKEDAWNAKREQGVRFVDTAMGSDATLYALINPLYSTDYIGVYSSINRYFREIYSTTGKKLPIFDTWAIVFNEKYGLNLVPYLESWGLAVSDSVKNDLMASGAEPIYFIRDMVSDEGTATGIKDKHGKKGEYDLISMSDFAREGLWGSVRFVFDIDDFDAIKGKILSINDGDKEMARLPIDSPEMSVDLPAGVYKVAPPIADNNQLFNRLYVVVPAGGMNEYRIGYSPSDQISGGNDVIVACRGYWTEETRPFIAQIKGRNMVFDYQDTYPNSGWTSSANVFSRLILSDSEGNAVYEKSVNGGWYDTFVDDGVTHVEIPVDEGYELAVYYEHPSDMRFTSQLTGDPVIGFDIPADTYSRTYVVTRYGLIPKDALESDPDAAYSIFKERVIQKADQLIGEIGVEGLHDPFKTSPELINQMNMLIKDLRPEDQERYIGTFLEQGPAEDAGKSDDPKGDTEDGTGSDVGASIPSGTPEKPTPDGGSGSKDSSGDPAVKDSAEKNWPTDKANDPREDDSSDADGSADDSNQTGSETNSGHRNPVDGANDHMDSSETDGADLPANDKGRQVSGITSTSGNGSHGINGDPTREVDVAAAASVREIQGVEEPSRPHIVHVDEEHHWGLSNADDSENAADVLDFVALGASACALAACLAIFLRWRRGNSE